MEKQISKKIYKGSKISKSLKSLSLTGEYRGAVNSIYNLKNGAPKKPPIVFNIGSSYSSHFISKVQTEEFKK